MTFSDRDWPCFGREWGPRCPNQGRRLNLELPRFGGR
jgi:hypothetical protein